MIKGQLPIIESIDKMYQPPAFTILVGAEGSGRKTLVRYMSEKLDLETVPIGNKVDDIRDNLQFKAYALGVFDMFPSLEILFFQLL